MQADYKSTQLQGITDLTVLAEVKQGFVPGTFTPVTYAERLRRVLRVLNAVRQASREAALQPSPFADSIGRFRAIHFFRFAVVPPRDHEGSHQLFLNVTFDGAWEPYMRIIWGPLGTLLDSIFCHCIGYPMAFQSSFSDYVRWVRKHEVVSSFFYADSAATVADLQYWKELDDLVRSNGDRPNFDLSATGLALSAHVPQPIPSAFAVSSSLRVLKAFDGLRENFPTQPDSGPGRPFSQSDVLLRFAQDLLADLREWIERGLFDPGQPFDQLRPTFDAERVWLMTPRNNGAAVKERLAFNRRAVQAGILEPFPPDVTQGLFVMLRVTDADQAKAWLAAAPISAQDTPPNDGIFRTLALTYRGLLALGFKAEEGRLPREFIDGMEARAGILGDVRGNHPDHWKRPRRNWPPTLGELKDRGPPIELTSVHILLQLRTALVAGEQDPKGYRALPRLLDDLLQQVRDGAGLEALFAQPMRSNAPSAGESAGRDHFGYADGISQPSLSAAVPPPIYFSDQVKRGEVFVGYANSRGDTPSSLDTPDPVLDNGTFVAVRKLRTYPERYENSIARSVDRQMPDAGVRERDAAVEDIKAMLVGRRSDGAPLASGRGPRSNDFDFRADGSGVRCPFHAHIRRANPRATHPATPAPRIVRRGMSYGPAYAEAPNEPRGVVFMAYNASLAEQFEVIQRWLATGNSSGQSSTVSDPLLGVPEVGQPRLYRYVDSVGRVRRVDMGEDPFVTVEWGLYAFVPALGALQNLSAAPVPLPAPAQALKPMDAFEEWRVRLEDDAARATTWTAVRNAPSSAVSAGEYGVLVGKQASVLDVLRDGGSNFSVCGYGKRMEESIGHGYLGMDDVGQPNHAELAPEINEIIERHLTEEQAFNTAIDYAAAYLKMRLDAAKNLTGISSSAVDLTEYGRSVLASICGAWFGLPDERLMKRGTRADDELSDGVPRCPGHFLTVSRFIFSPHPDEDAVAKPARERGKLILQAVERLMDEVQAGTVKPTDLVADIRASATLKRFPEHQARTVAGLMLGFPPTVFGNLVGVLMRWISSMELWSIQLSLWQDPPADPNPYVHARSVLYDRFLAAMRVAPVPYVIWRTSVGQNPFGTQAEAGSKVVVGLGSAVADPNASSMLMFGGARDGPLKTTHACPGYGAAMGVMLGMTAALLQVGALSRTADPRILQVSRLPD